MNRLPSLKASKLQLSNNSPHQVLNATGATPRNLGLDARRQGGRATSQHSLFAPLHYERNYAYPLLVWLHGERGSERELRRVMPHVSVRNYVAVAPRGNTMPGGSAGAYTWLQSASAVAEADDRVRHGMAAAKRRFNVHPSRTFIAGYGAGGTMALRLALQSPESYAGAISIGGGMPSGNCPLKSINAARRLPLMLSSCSESEQYAQSQVADDLRLLHSAGFALDIRQYPGEHDLTTCMLADIDRWVMERVCSPSASPTATRR